MNVIKTIRHSRFVQDAAVTISGSFVGQLILVLASPILTRLYSPTNFGLFALFVATVGMFSAFNSMRYNMAIVLPRLLRNANQLLLISLAIALAFSVLLVIVGLIAFESVQEIMGEKLGSGFVVFLALGFLFSAENESLTYYCVRMRQFSDIARAKVVQAVTITAIGILFALIFGDDPIGLILGFVVSYVVASALLFHFCKPTLSLCLPDKTAILRSIGLIRRYVDFPKFSVPAGLLSAFSNHGFLMLFSLFYGSAALGMLALTFRVVGAPVTIISGSIQKVVVQRLVANRADSMPLAPVILKTAGVLFAVALGPTILLMIFAEELFSFVFGENWAVAGRYCAIVAPLMLVKFAVTSVSKFYVFEKQRAGLIWQLFYGLGITASLVVGYIDQSVELSLFAFTWFSIAMYVLHVALSVKFTGERISIATFFRGEK